MKKICTSVLALMVITAAPTLADARPKDGQQQDKQGKGNKGERGDRGDRGPRGDKGSGGGNGGGQGGRRIVDDFGTGGGRPGKNPNGGRNDGGRGDRGNRGDGWKNDGRRGDGPRNDGRRGDGIRNDGRRGDGYRNGPNDRWRNPGPNINVRGKFAVSPRKYRWGGYRAPPGWRYRRLTYGWRLPPVYWGRSYWIDSYWDFDLFEPDYGYRWIRYGNDAVLVDERTGMVIDVRYDIFY